MVRMGAWLVGYCWFSKYLKFFSEFMSSKWCPMEQCSMCWEPGASALLWSSPTSSWLHWDVFSIVHSLTHPLTQTPIPSPAQVTAIAFLPLVGPGCGCWKVQDWQCKAPDTYEDLHNIKLQLQNTLTGQMQDCGRNGKKAFPCVFNKKPHVFSLHVIQLDACGREGHKFRLHDP